MDADKNKFPKYLLKVNGQLVFLPFEEAHILFASGFLCVEIGMYVLGENFTVRDMNASDRSKISNAADDSQRASKQC